MLVLLHFHDARLHAGRARVPVPVLRVLRRRHQPGRRLARGAAWACASRCSAGSRSRSSRSACSRSSSPTWAQARVGGLRDGGAGALGHRQGPHQDEREERDQGARSRRTQQSSLFKWVAVLTGSKNALKGVGLLPRRLAARGARVSRRRCWAMAAALAADPARRRPRRCRASWARPRARRSSGSCSRRRREVNVLSAARFFLFGARDIWFVVGVPVFLSTRARLELHARSAASSRSG